MVVVLLALGEVAVMALGVVLLPLREVSDGLVIGALLWFQTPDAPRSEVVGASPSREGWKTIEYEGVRVDIPSSWGRLDMSDCEFQFERWARPGSASCEYEDGAAFYGSANFDPAFGPGVRRTTENGIRIWGGYAYAGDFAVYAADPDRDVVREVLDSAREARQ